MPIVNQQTITVRVDSSLKTRLSDLDESLAAEIRSYLTIVNQRKVDAVRRGDWGAEEAPDVIELWRHVGEDLVMPRGFAHVLRAGVERLGFQIEWDDQTTAPSVPLSDMLEMRPISLRPDQEAAARELIGHRQGVLQAPTGSGKTVVGLEVFRRLGLRGLVLVNNVGLAEQWRERAREHLGIEPGLIGDGVWDERPLTIAIMQTLISRGLAAPVLSLDGMAFWRRRGLVIFDECHHAIANTYSSLLERACSRYLIGKTATPLDQDWRRPILLAVLGPVVHRMGSTVLEPTVHVVKTDFQWRPNGREVQLVDSKAIYRHVIKALEQDPDRLALIAKTITCQPAECAQLVVCKRLEYLSAIRQRLYELEYDMDRVFFMRGSESRERRAEIAELADDGHCVILATVADEGVDIPRLDRIHLTWPARQADPVVQQIGRVLREHPHKLPPVVIDYADHGQGMLRAQAYARANNVYRRKGWKVETKGER